MRERTTLRPGSNALAASSVRIRVMPRRSPSLVLVHIVWATSRRRPMLPPSLDERLIAMMGSKARELRCAMLAAGCAPDHVHAVVRLASSVSLGELVRRLKGASAHELNHDGTMSRPFAWQDGYWAESLGPADLAPIVRYVRDQREHHDASHPAERWTSAVASRQSAPQVGRTLSGPEADRHRGPRKFPRDPCHTTRHADPHRAVRRVEVTRRVGEVPARRSSEWGRRN